jgi:DNA-binding MarR family transcriptional regulator
MVMKIDKKLALSLAEKINRAMNAHSAEMKTARDYGTGFSLYHSEVHLLDTISLHKGENEKELATRLGVTKGAVGQVAKKLVSKGLAESYQLPENKKEVYFLLTALGEKAVAGHHRHHERINAALFAYIGELEEKDVEIIMEFLDVMTQSLDRVTSA